MENVFRGIFDTDATEVISLNDFLICVGCSLIIGLIISYTYMYRTTCTKSFVMTLALLPAIVCIVIMMVNGNIGTGVAVAGAFSLVRFRSAEGTAREIGMLFMAMGSGLIAGMGYIGYAMLFTIIMCGVWLVYNKFGFGKMKNMHLYKTLYMEVSEDIDYMKEFDDVFKDYTKEVELITVMMIDEGKRFKLTYDIKLKNLEDEKKFIDKLRGKDEKILIRITKHENNVVEL